MTHIDFVCPLPPSANRATRSTEVGVLDSREARAYRRNFAKKSLQRSPHLILDHPGLIHPKASYEISARFFFKRIWKKKKLADDESPFLELDLDNRLKILIDSVKKLFQISDANFFNIHLYKDEDPSDPRVEVSITRLTGLNLRG